MNGQPTSSPRLAVAEYGRPGALRAQFRGCIKVEVAISSSSSPVVCTVSVDVMQH